MCPNTVTNRNTQNEYNNNNKIQLVYRGYSTVSYNMYAAAAARLENKTKYVLFRVLLLSGRGLICTR